MDPYEHHGHIDLPADDAPDPPFFWTAVLLPPAWLGYHGLHRHAAFFLCAVVLLQCAAELLLAFALVNEPAVEAWLVEYLGAPSLNLYGIVWVVAALWCGLRGHHWRAHEPAPEDGRRWPGALTWTWAFAVVQMTVYIALAVLHRMSDQWLVL